MIDLVHKDYFVDVFVLIQLNDYILVDVIHKEFVDNMVVVNKE